MAPYVPPHLRAQRSAPRAALAGGDAEPSQGGAETKEIEEEEERPSASRVARGPSADNFGARKAQSNGRLLQRARFDAVMDELNVIMCPSLRAHCDAGCEQERARRAAEVVAQAEIKAWRWNSLDVAGVVDTLLDGLAEGFVYASCAGRLTDKIHREIDYQAACPIFDAPACVRERIHELLSAGVAAAIATDERQHERQRRHERQERVAAAEAAEAAAAAAEAEAAAELAELIGFAEATVASDERAIVMEERRAAAEAEAAARLAAEAEAERAAKAERAAAAVAAAAAEAERAAEAAEALRLKILALAQPAAEGVSPCDAAGVDQAPTGYSSVGSSGAPPSLSPLSPAFPLGCASVFGSGLSAWLRFGWDPGGAVVMRGCEQRSAAACA